MFIVHMHAQLKIMVENFGSVTNFSNSVSAGFRPHVPISA